jgi:uncharacterized membrane protein
MIFLTLLYPYWSLKNKTGNFSPAGGLTLDGTAYLAKYSPDEMDAIRWLRTAPPGAIVEAVGGSYTQYARISINSGQPTVLGWPGHVSQWRGGAAEMGSRQGDIDTLYRTADWTQSNAIIQQYHVRYIYIGDLERATYRVNEVKFQQHLRIVFQQGSVIIYEAPVTAAASLKPAEIGQP